MKPTSPLGRPFAALASFVLSSAVLLFAGNHLLSASELTSGPAVRGEILPDLGNINLLQNGGFNDGKIGWSTRQGSGVVLETELVTEGNEPLLKIKKSGASGPAWIISEPFEISPKTPYQVTGLYRTLSANVSTLGELILQTAPSFQQVAALPFPGSIEVGGAQQGHQLLFRGGWKRKTKTIAAPNGHQAGRLVFAMSGAGGEIDLANLRVGEPVAETRPKATHTPESPLSREETLLRLSARPDSRASVESVNGSPTLLIDGQRQVPFVHLTDVVQPRRGYIGEFARHGIPIHIIPLFNQGGSYWKAKGQYDFTKLDETIYNAIGRDPEGYFIVYLNLLAYKEWHRDFPDATARRRNGEQATSRQGDFAPASYWSLEYQEQAFDFIRAYVDHINRQPYSRAVVGYYLTGGQDGQFYYQTTNDGSPLHDGQSPGDLPLFRRWLDRRYHGDAEALRRAWRDNSLNFETATSPLKNKRFTGVFLNPATDRPVYDFMTFLNEGVAQFLSDAAGIIKEKSPKPVIVGAYYGRGASFSVYPMFAETNVMLKERTIDFMGAQGGYYGRREAGSSGLINWVYDSVRRANVIPMMELDFRTWLGGFRSLQHDFNVARYWNLEDLTAAVNREAGRQLSFGGGVWWMEMTGGWFHDESIMRSFGKTHRLGQSITRNDVKSTPAEIVLVADEDTYLWTTEQINIWNGPQYLSLNRQQRAFSEAGVKLDFYYLSDLLNLPSKDYKVYYFINPYYPGERMRAFARELQAAGKTVVWQYAPGWMSDHGFSVETMKDLTGFTFRHDGIASEGLRARFVAEEETGGRQEVSDLLHRLVGEPVGTGADLRGDRFVPVAGYDGVLSRFEKGNEPSAVWRRDPATGHLGIYLGHPAALTPQLLANIAKASGVHQFTEPGDLFFHHRDDLIVMHGVEGGCKTLDFAAPVNLKELLNEKLASQNSRTFSFDLKPGETLWFQVEKAAPEVSP